MTKTSTLAAMSAALFLTAACSSTPGTPGPAPSSTAPDPSGANSSSTARGVPKVSAPLNAGKYEQDPCSLLTKEQAGQLIGSVQSNSKESGSNPACNWHGEDGDGISVTFLPNQGGLATVYANGQNGASAYFEPAPAVSGYPAAFTDVLDDRKTTGCQVMVGITDNEVVAVSTNLMEKSPSYGNPCPLVTKAAEQVVAKLKEGA